MTEMSYIVRKDSPYKSLEDIKEASLSIAETEESETIDEVLRKYKKEFDTDIATNKYIDYLSLGKSLLRGKEEVMLLNEGFRSLIEESEENFSQDTRKIGSVLVENKKKKVKMTRK